MMTAAPFTPRTNWSGNVRFHSDRVCTPTTVAEVQEIVRANAKLKGFGSRHSFNDLADTTSIHVDMRALKALRIHTAERTATVGAGWTTGELAPALNQAGFALSNIPSHPNFTVGGSIATATHGSGVTHGNMATLVSSLELVTADGDMMHLTREADPETFRTAVVHLGGLGLVTAVTLKLVPRFEVAQTVYENFSFDQLERDADAVLGAAYSVSLFTDWQKGRAKQVWLKHKVELGATFPAYEALPKEFYGATLQKKPLHPVSGKSSKDATEQMGRVGPWFERLPHFTTESVALAGEEIQSEYFVAREHAYEAIRAVETLRDKITPLLKVSELRTVAADDLPMSMQYGRESFGLHFTWKPKEEAVRAVLPAIEAKLAPFDARPHWGKVFTMDGKTLRRRFAGLQAYRDLAARLDPQGKFRNAFLARTVFGL